ncbi:hypothetical protein Esti_002746 [Eimeria stiedai]
MVELKNDVQLTGYLHSVDQFLNIKLTQVVVSDPDKCPHLVSPLLTRALTLAARIAAERTAAAATLCYQTLAPGRWPSLLHFPPCQRQCVFAMLLLLLLQLSVRNCFIRGSAPGDVDLSALRDLCREENKAAQDSKQKAKHPAAAAAAAAGACVDGFAA